LWKQPSPRYLEAAAESLLQHFDIADAVLEADDRRAFAAVFGDLRRRFCRVPALHRDADNIRFAKRFRARAVIDRAGFEVTAPTAIVAERQAMSLNVRGELAPAD
jgi:hypothetical protein